MTHYLRHNGITVVDCDCTLDDLRIVIDIGSYSQLLLRHPYDRDVVIHDFGHLQELRGKFHESNNDGETPDEFAERHMKALASKYNMNYVTD